MLNDFLNLLTNYQESISIFFAGSILTKKKFWQIIGAVFAGMFGLYRLWLFIEALKDPKFRLFLLKIVTSIVSLFATMLVIFLFTGCNVPQIEGYTSIKEDELELSNLSITESSSKSDNLKTSSQEHNANAGIRTDQIIKLNKRFKKISKRILRKKNLAMVKKNFNHEAGVPDNDKVEKFKLFEPKKFNGNMIACNKSKTRIVLLNREIGRLCKQYYIIIKATSRRNDRILVYSHLELNECEGFGRFLKYRVKSKFKLAKNRWVDLRNWNTRYIPLKSSHTKIREDAIVDIIIKTNVLRKTLANNTKCVTSRVRSYFNNLYFGIIPGRKLNNE